MKIGLLDFGEIQNEKNELAVIHNTIELVRLAEGMGFSRYWIAEHHTNDVAWRNPEIVLTLLAGSTEKIKVGVAGVLLAINPVLQTAQRYKLLENLFPGRIDLGIGRGLAGSEKSKAIYENENYISNIEINTHQQRIEKLIAFMSNQEYPVPPYSGNAPEIWMLRTSASSHDFIIRNKLNWSLSLLHTSKLPEPEICQHFKSYYLETNGLEPKFNVTLSVYLGSTDANCAAFVREKNNITVNISTTEKYLVEQILEIKHKYKTDELILLNLCLELEEKKNLMQLIKEAGILSI